MLGDYRNAQPNEKSDDAASATSGDPFDGLVLDEAFIRGGIYEPPARTRIAIARFGNQQTSWRHAGGLRSPSAGAGSAPPVAGGGTRTALPSQRLRTRPHRSSSVRRCAIGAIPLLISALAVTTILVVYTLG
jgi:hypothetical protein